MKVKVKQKYYLIINKKHKLIYDASSFFVKPDEVFRLATYNSEAAAKRQLNNLIKDAKSSYRLNKSLFTDNTKEDIEAVEQAKLALEITEGAEIKQIEIKTIYRNIWK